MLDRQNLLEREPERRPDAGPTPVAVPALTPARDARELDLGRSAHRETIVGAVREVEERTGAVGFVSADRADRAKPAVLTPGDLIRTVERAEAALGLGGLRKPVYAIAEGGSIVNTVTGRIEYVPVYTDAARAELQRTSAAGPDAGARAPGPQAPSPQPEPQQAGGGAPPRAAPPVDERIYAPRGGAPREVVRHSHYDEALQHVPGEPSGASRRYGDADRDTQRRCMDLVIAQGRAHGMTDHEIAVTLAITRVESGFNPDAAAGTTSASGLGQFVDRTGAAYGLDASNRWNAEAQADALVRHTADNMRYARAHGHGGADLDRYTYAYHHDGPSLAHGGLAIADAHVVPRIAMYEQYVRTH